MSTSELEKFKLLAKDDVGKIYIDRFQENVRVLVMRGPVSLCVYLGIPVDHPLAGNNYDDLPVSCNGGLTFGGTGEGKGDFWPKGYYWYGWDYAHCNDLCFYDLDRMSASDRKSKPWTVEAVESELWQAVYDMKKLMKLTENARQRVATV